MVGVHSTLAPESTSTAGARPLLGIGVAMHGRSTDRSLPIRRSAAAMVAPVLPALTMALAFRSRTSLAHRTSDESFLRRMPCAGSSSMLTTSVHATSSNPAVSPTWSGGPTRSTGTPMSAAARAPATISPGALSPPIASSATGSSAGFADEGVASPLRVNSIDLYSLAVVVPTTGRAHDVRLLHLLAVRADAARGTPQDPVRRLAAPALRL